MTKDNGLYNPKRCIPSLEVSRCGSDNSLQEILPVEHDSPWNGKLFTYKRIKTESLSRDVIHRVFELRGAQDLLHIIECKKYIITQYDKKPPLYISLETGRIFSTTKQGYDLGQIEHQAAIMITILNKAGLVENLHSTRMS